nr:hypothetical protein [Propionicimonas sp.]
MKLKHRLAATVGVAALITVGSAVNAFAIIPVGGCPNYDDFRIVRDGPDSCYAYEGSRSVSLPNSFGAYSGINAGYFIKSNGTKVSLTVGQNKIYWDSSFKVTKVGITWAP